MPSHSETSLLLSNGHANGLDGDRRQRGFVAKLRRSLALPLATSHAALPLCLQCIQSGLVDSISYKTSKTWVAFMTGNITQLGLSIVDVVIEMLFSAGTTEQEREASERFILSGSSFAGFILGAFLTSRLLMAFGNTKSRFAFIGLPLLQSIPYIFYATLITIQHAQSEPHVHVRSPAPQIPEDPDNDLNPLTMSTWAIAMLAVSMGSQAVLALHASLPGYSTTVVFTAPLATLCSDPAFPWALFGWRWSTPTSIDPASSSAFSGSSQSKREEEVSKATSARHRGLSIFALLLGSMLGGVLMQVQERMHEPGLKTCTWAWWSAVALQMIIVVSWYRVPSQEDSEEHED